MATSKAVAKAENTAVMEFDPSMFESDAGQGMENMGQDDLALIHGLRFLSLRQIGSSGET